MTETRHVWTYETADGLPVKRKIRVDLPEGKKKYLWQKFDANAWIDGEPDGPQLLYNLPGLTTDSGNETVYIVEGEKAADCAANLGLVSTTSGGATSAGNAVLYVLYGFPRVVILPDNDKPGESYAQELATLLHAQNTDQEIVIVRLPGLKPKGDLVDWIRRRMPNWDGFRPFEGDELDILSGLRDELQQAVAAHGCRWEPNLSIVSDEPWPEIRAFRDVPMPWPVDVFPPVLNRFMEELAWSIQSPREIVAAQVLGVLATCLQGKLVAQGLSKRHTEPLSLFVLSVANPSERKSPAVRELKAPIDAWEAGRAAELAPDILKSSIKRRLIKQQIADLEKGISKKDANVDDCTKRIAALEESMPPVMVAPQMTVSDFTTEKLGQLLGVHGGVMACLDGEGTAFDSISGRYRGGRPEPDLFLRGYSGDHYRVDRLGRESIHLPWVCLTLSLSVQPLRLVETLSDQVYRGLGLVARFLYLAPETMAGTRAIEERNTPMETVAKYHWMVQRMLDVAPLAEPWRLCMSADAAGQWTALAQRVEDMQKPDGALHHDLLGQWGAKFAGAMLRVAALLHVAQWVEKHFEEHFWRLDLEKIPPISGAAMASAVRAADCFLDHALWVFDRAQADPKTVIAKRILEWVTENGLVQFSRRDAHHKVLHLVDTVEEMDPPLALLEARGFIRRLPLVPPSEKGGRISIRYEVNPEVQKSDYTTYKTPSAPLQATSEIGSVGSVGNIWGSENEKQATPASSPKPEPTPPVAVQDPFDEYITTDPWGGEEDDDLLGDHAKALGFTN